MKRALALAAILALLAVPASGISPSRWSRVPESAFRPLAVGPVAGETAPLDTSQNRCDGQSETSPGVTDRTPRNVLGTFDPLGRAEIADGGGGHAQSIPQVLVVPLMIGVPSVDQGVPALQNVCCSEQYGPFTSRHNELTITQILPGPRDRVDDLHFASPSVAVVCTKRNIPVKPTPAPTARPTYAPRPVPLPPPYIAAKGWATYQPGTGLWASPSALIRNWPGVWVRVCGPLACRSIELRNECACGDRHGERTLLDLSAEAFGIICGPLSRGVCAVQVVR